MAAGTNHFIHPGPYMGMMPSYLPWPAELVWLSGLLEMIGGVGVLFSRSRVVAGWGLVALLIAVFPANLNVAVHGWPGVSLSPWILWLRLPLQIVLVWWVFETCLSESSRDDAKRSWENIGKYRVLKAFILFRCCNLLWINREAQKSSWGNSRTSPALALDVKRTKAGWRAAENVTACQSFGEMLAGAGTSWMQKGKVRILQKAATMAFCAAKLRLEFRP
jgi:uncharacterized membrane protein